MPLDWISIWPKCKIVFKVLHIWMGTNVLDWIETHMRKSILHFRVHGQIYNLRLSQFRLQIKPSNERKHLLTCVYILLSN